MLEGVVDSGTARNLSNSHYKIAGKTGTAQISLSKEGYDKSLYQASFAGYFPADHPKYSCIVVVNAPSKSIYYGNLVAGPIFRAITDRIYVREFELQEGREVLTSTEADAPYSKSGHGAALVSVFNRLQLPYEQSEMEAAWVSTRSTPEGVIITPRSVSDQLVPNVVDMGLQDALYLLEGYGIQVQVRGRGTVRGQSIRAGTPVSEGMVITLNMSIAEG